MGRILVLLLALGGTAFGDAKVVVELVPDNPGPYTGGESLTVDVWLHSQIPQDVRLALIQFDFADTDPGILLDPTFAFDFSSLSAVAYQTHPELPVPWTVNSLDCICPEAFLLLPVGGSLHIGSIGVRLPTEGGVYRLDALNADQPDDALGGRLHPHLSSQIWRAFTGELMGGGFDFVVTPAIPTLSAWGAIIMTSLLIAFGCLLIMRRMRTVPHNTFHSEQNTLRSSSLRVTPDTRLSTVTRISIVVVSLAITAAVTAQPAPIPSRTVVVSVDSGIVSATGVGAAPVAVFSQLVSADGAPWIRLHFAQVQLSGSTETATESYLSITAVENGGVQTLDSLALTRWRNTSAYFNGDSVLVELLAYPNTGANRVAIEKIVAGVQSELDSTASICGNDDRVSSTDPRAGRIIPGGCTAFLFNDHPRCLLTAGHCPFLGAMEVLEFNVPLSDPDGTVNHPGPEDQYPIDQASIQYQITTDPFLGPGDDWAYFGVFDNTNTGLSPLEAQGASYQLVQFVPGADGSTLRITGYGVDDDPPGPTPPLFRNQDSQTEQTDSGPYQDKVGTTLKYVIDTMGGNSGSAVEHMADSLVYAIHTHGNCTTEGVNKGTAIDHPGLQDALACPIGVCADCNANGILDQCDIDCASPCRGCNVPGCGGSDDCNSNGLPDECDLSTGTSQDCNMNNIPDECDISAGTSLDCNLNDVPDECDLTSGTSQDCNVNNIPDECDISAGTSQDCNVNNIPDECDISAGTSQDCNLNGVPDECDPGSLCGSCQLHGDVFPFDQTTGGNPNQDPNGDNVGNCRVDLDDLLIILGAFAISPDYCPDLGGPFPDATNLFPCGEEGCVDWMVDIDDLVTELAAFAGNFPCPHPCFPGACCLTDGTCRDGAAGSPHFCAGGMSHSDCLCLGGTYLGNETDCVANGGSCSSGAAVPACAGGPGPGPMAPLPPPSMPTAINLVADPGTIAPGGSATVESFVVDASDLGAYQVALGVTGGTTGTLDLEVLAVDTMRGDYVFTALSSVTATDQDGVRLGGALYSGGVNVGVQKYLGTFTFRASSDASGTFTVDFRAAETLLRDSNRGTITWQSLGAVQISIQEP